MGKSTINTINKCREDKENAFFQVERIINKRMRNGTFISYIAYLDNNN
jgi:hypothetical protein